MLYNQGSGAAKGYPSAQTLSFVKFSFPQTLRIEFRLGYLTQVVCAW